MKKSGFLYFTVLLTILFFSQGAWAAGTTVHSIRVGVHPKFTRIVFDSEGARPFRIGPVSREGITVYYKKLDLLVKPELLSRKARGAIAKVTYHEERNVSVIFINFRYLDTGLKSFYLPADPPKKGHYMLVLDFYTQGIRALEKTIPPPTEARPGEGPEKKEKVSKAPSKMEEPTKPSPAPVSDQEEPAPPPEESEEEIPTPETVFFGEASVIANDVDGEEEPAKFTEYRDFNTITGEMDITYEKKDQYFSRFKAENVGQEDQYYNLVVAKYGKFKIDASYDEIPHRYAFGAKNIYSGAGTGNLTLSNPQDVPPADSVNRLNALLANAEPLDIEVQRKKAELNVDVVALDPFNFRVESSRENREGTKPFFGSFGLDHTVEIPEPVNYDTTEVRLIGEYAKRPTYFSVSYYFSQFKNNINTLTWDNPFRATDAILNPSKGLIDLAPDNQYHNVSLSGAYMGLPLKTRVSASAAWGRMKQNDNLVPYTINTAITTPSGDDASDPSSLPQQSVDVEVATSLYNFSLTSRPLGFMRFKGRFRYFEYNNNTEQINFPGFVDADDFFATPDAPGATSIVNRPVSYDKTTAGLELGLDLYKRMRLTLGYTFEQTDRTNREVDRQKDYIFLASIDSNLFSWLDLRASYERTDRDIINYDFDVYLEGGEDLFQLPGLRKYDVADVIRDRFQLLGTLYPFEPLALSGSFIYGQDDYESSPFGLIEDTHYILSLEADYTVTDRANIYAFYSYEKYRNRQKDRGEVPTQPFPVDSDWFSRSEDVVNTVGAGLKVALFPNRLNLDVSYSYSDVNGHLDFFTPAVATADFPIVDETKLQILNAKLKYRAWKGLSFTLGYLWEKFDYDDFNTQGFTNVPVDAAGNYNGAYLIGTLPQDYDANVFYLKATYRF